MTFLPTGPISISLSVIIWLIAVYHLARGDWKRQVIGLTLITSWFCARITTATADPSFLVAGYTVCCGACLLVGTRIALAIGLLYAIRLILLPVMLLIAPTANVFWLWYWDVNLVPLLAQLILAIGASWNGKHSGTRRLRLGAIRSIGRATARNNLPQARRMHSRSSVDRNRSDRQGCS